MEKPKEVIGVLHFLWQECQVGEFSAFYLAIPLAESLLSLGTIAETPEGFLVYSPPFAPPSSPFSVFDDALKYLLEQHKINEVVIAGNELIKKIDQCLKK